MVTNKAGEMIEIQRVKSQIRDLARENAVDMMAVSYTHLKLHLYNEVKCTIIKKYL